MPSGESGIHPISAILNRIAEKPLSECEGHELKVTVIATYRSEQQVIGARRPFTLERREGELRLIAPDFAAEQLRSRLARRRLRKRWSHYLEI